MYWNPISRRYFLQGAGSICLALPTLESLVPKALAQSANGNQKSLICFFKPNGSYPEDYFPHNPYNPASELAVRNLGGEIREFDLSRINGSLSNVLAADFDSLKPQMNVYLGLSTAQENHNPSTPFATSQRFPSIDQIVVKSARYNTNRGQAIAIQGTTAGYTNASSYDIANGDIRAADHVKSALVMFQRLFSDLSAGDNNGNEEAAQAAFRRLLMERKALDQVLGDYNRLLRRSQLSAADKLVLEEYMEFVNQKQADLAVLIAEGPGATSMTGEVPGQPPESVNGSPISMTDTMIDLMVAAIKTNVCSTFNFQLATSVDETTFPLEIGGYNRGSYHSEISHSFARKNDHLIVDRYLFAKVAKTFNLLATPLNGNAEQTYADNTCIYVSGDMGAGEVPSNHTSHSAIAVTLSGKNIPIKSGRCLAYSSKPKGDGYPHNQLLIGLMQAVGASDWRETLARNGLNLGAGFGEYGGTQRSISDQEKQAALPFLFA
ncbi:MAG: DUF1552 domain-containing protein [Oligoflexus sp.]